MLTMSNKFYKNPSVIKVLEEAFGLKEITEQVEKESDALLPSFKGELIPGTYTKEISFETGVRIPDDEEEQDRIGYALLTKYHTLFHKVLSEHPEFRVLLLSLGCSNRKHQSYVLNLVIPKEELWIEVE